MGNFLLALANLVNLVLTVFYWLILIRALIGWVNPDPHNPIVQFLYMVTEPVLTPIRRVLSRYVSAGIDLSPLIVFFLIIFLRGFLVKTLIDLSYRLR